MLPRPIACAAALLIAALLIAPLDAQAQSKAGSEAAAAEPCRSLSYRRNSYIVCELDLRRHVLKTYWKRQDGEAYGSIWGLVRRLWTDGKRPLFVMNAGMFHKDRSPVGLYVEDGKVLVDPDTADGEGNFYMKPNGVFFIAGDRAGVLETARFLRDKPKVDFATQSGPMLVIDGALHPKISPRGSSRHVRNGVGVRGPHTVVLAISMRPVTFGDLATLFKDRLGIANALYLDGSISGIYAARMGPKHLFVPIGPMLGAYARSH
jgi:uncharacterized protein YigE (DUF2233 family)